MVTTVNLSRLNCTETSLIELTSCLPNIDSLTLSDMKVTVNVLRNIRNNCKVLKRLNVSECRNIMDDDIKAFCLFEDDETDNSSSRNSTLEHLDVNQTRVTAVGVAHALKSFPNLLSIHHSDVFDAIYNLHFDDLKNNAVSHLATYNLQSLLIASLHHHSIESLEMCTSVCPNLKQLTVHGIASQSEVNAFTKFCKLQEVDFSSTTTINLVPFIEARGAILEKLSISGGKICVETLLKCCQKLKFLRLKHPNFLPLKNLQFDSTNCKFQHLKDICLYGLNFEVNNIVDSVKLILSCCPNLEKLSLLNCFAFTKTFIMSISKYNSLQNVRELDLDDSNVNFSDAEAFLLASPNLKSFSLHNGSVSKKEYEQLEYLRPFVQMSWDYYDDDDNDDYYFGSEKPEFFYDYDFYD